MQAMIWGAHLRKVSVSTQVGFDRSTFFLLADATQIINFHEFITSTTRMKVSAHSKMSAITSAPSKQLTDPHSVSQFGARGMIRFLVFLYLPTSPNNRKLFNA